jgi:hypothetical protein
MAIFYVSGGFGMNPATAAGQASAVLNNFIKVASEEDLAREEEYIKMHRYAKYVLSKESIKFLEKICHYKIT